MYAGPPTSSRSPERPSSSFNVTKSIASPRSTSLTILSKMRRCASRKKSAESITSAARLKASLCSRIAPSTDRSASRLCGRVRSATAVSGIGVVGREQCSRKEKRPEKKISGRAITDDERLLAFGADFDFQADDDVAMELDRHGVVAQLLDRIVHLD